MNAIFFQHIAFTAKINIGKDQRSEVFRTLKPNDQSLLMPMSLLTAKWLQIPSKTSPSRAVRR